MQKKYIYVSICVFLFFLLIWYFYIFYSIPNDSAASVYQKNDPDNYEITGENLVNNSTFDDILNNPWKFPIKNEDYKPPIESGFGRNNSLGISWSHNKDRQRYSFCQRIDVRPLPEALLVEGWFKTEKLYDSDENETGLVKIYAQCINYEEEPIYGVIAEAHGRYITGTNDWRKLAVAINIPPSTEILYIGVSSSGSQGTIYADDIQAFHAIKKTQNHFNAVELSGK